MSDVAAAAKPAKSPAAPAVSAAPSKPAQTLREAQPKKFPPSALKALGYGDCEIMTATAPRGMSFSEALLPIAWSSVASVVARDSMSTRNLRDGAGTLILLDSEDGSYHAHLRIRKVIRDKLNNPNGLDVMCIGPSFDPQTGEARPINLATGKAWVDPVKPEEKAV